MTLAFAVATLITLAGSIVAVTRSNILHAVLGLAVALVGVSGVFFNLSSPFVAIMEVLIYVGGIAVTMLFAVMLSSVANPKAKESQRRHILAALVALGFFGAGTLLILGAHFDRASAVSELPSAAWNLREVGTSLLGRYNVAFETLSAVLLLAIVGAIVIAGKERAA